jgi:hypothetical protein
MQGIQAVLTSTNHLGEHPPCASFSSNTICNYAQGVSWTCLICCAAVARSWHGWARRQTPGVGHCAIKL